MGELYIDNSNYADEESLFKKACAQEFKRLKKEGTFTEVNLNVRDQEMESAITTYNIFIVIGGVLFLAGLVLTFVAKSFIAIPFYLLSLLLVLYGLRKKIIFKKSYTQSTWKPEVDNLFINARFFYSYADIVSICSSPEEFAPYYRQNRLRKLVLNNLGVITRDRYEDITNMLIFSNDMELFSLACYHQKDGNFKFRGTVFAKQHNINCTGTLRIMTKNLSQGKYRNFLITKCGSAPIQLSLNNPSFDNEFDLFSNNHETAFYLLTPPVIEKLVELKKIYGDFVLAIISNGIYMSFPEIDKFIKISKNLYDTDLDKIKQDISDFVSDMNELAVNLTKNPVKIKL